MSIQKMSSTSPSKLMHDSIFEISRPKPLKHSKFNDTKELKSKKMFDDVREKTLSLIYGDRYMPRQDTLGEDSLMYDFDTNVSLVQKNHDS